MELFLLLLGSTLIIIGILGAFLPVLPGPLTSWFGLVTLYFSVQIEFNWSFLSITFSIALAVMILDYIIPMIGTKHFGGSKYGAYGTTVGLIIGVFIPIPFGILVGCFLGAFIGELFLDAKDIKRATKAAFGAFFGFLTSSFLKFIVAIVYSVLFIQKIIEYKEVFF